MKFNTTELLKYDVNEMYFKKNYDNRQNMLLGYIHQMNDWLILNKL